MATPAVSVPGALRLLPCRRASARASTGQIEVSLLPPLLSWLDLTRPEAELLRLLPSGSLGVEQVR
jgi:hypothetical protein